MHKSSSLAASSVPLRWITVSGLQQAPNGTVANPLDFDTYETTVDVGGRITTRTYDRGAKTLTTVLICSRQRSPFCNRRI